MHCILVKTGKTKWMGLRKDKSKNKYTESTGRAKRQFKEAT